MINLEREAVSLDGLPTLARARMSEDFPLGERFVFLFDPKWHREEPEPVTGTIGDVHAYDEPFRRSLPDGMMFPVLGTEARLLKGKAIVTLDSLEPSTLPDLPRQIMLNSPELRSKMPSAGYITLETSSASVPRIIGISMNDNALIPESAMPILQENEDLLEVWLLDGTDDPEKRAALERAIRNWSPEEPNTAAREPGRARRHTYMSLGSAYGRVAPVVPSDISYDNK